MSAARRQRRQAERDAKRLRYLAMGWTIKMSEGGEKLTQTERRVLRRNGRKVEHPHEAMRRLFRTMKGAGRRVTCACGKGTVWFDHDEKKWKGCKCAKVKGQEVDIEEEGTDE